MHASATATQDQVNAHYRTFAEMLRDAETRKAEAMRDAETNEAYRRMVTQEGTSAPNAEATRGRIRDYYGNVLAFARDGATVTIFGGPEGRHTLPEHLFDALSTHHGWEIVQEDNGR